MNYKPLYRTTHKKSLKLHTEKHQIGINIKHFQNDMSKHSFVHNLLTNCYMVIWSVLCNETVY